MPDAPKPLTPKQQAELADLALSLARNPKTRGQLAAAVRAGSDDPIIKNFVGSFTDVQEPRPAAPAPSDDPTKRPATMGDVQAALDEDRGKQRIAAAEDARKAQRQSMIDQGRFTPESMTKLEEFMTEHGYSNYEHAAVLFAHENPPTNTSMIGSERRWEMPTAKDLLADPKKVALNRAYQVVDEIRGRKRA